MPTFEELLEGVEHHLCVRHLYTNIKSKFGGGSMIRDLILAAARATYMQSWQEKMVELKQVSVKAHNHLMSFDPSCWMKSHFSAYPQCDIFMNNISESFNGRILKAQELPIISMMEWIWTYIITRFAKN